MLYAESLFSIQQGQMSEVKLKLDVVVKENER